MNNDTVFDPSGHVGETVTIRGIAYDARAGAIVELTDRTPIYISGLVEWKGDYEGKFIEVTGLLKERPSRVPSIRPGGEQVHGLGATYALDNASWKLVK